MINGDKFAILGKC